MKDTEWRIGATGSAIFILHDMRACLRKTILRDSEVQALSFGRPWEQRCRRDWPRCGRYSMTAIFCRTRRLTAAFSPISSRTSSTESAHCRHGSEWLSRQLLGAKRSLSASSLWDPGGATKPSWQVIARKRCEFGKMDRTSAIKRSRRFRFLAVVMCQNYSVTLTTGWVTP